MPTFARFKDAVRGMCRVVRPGGVWLAEWLYNACIVETPAFLRSGEAVESVRHVFFACHDSPAPGSPPPRSSSAINTPCTPCRLLWSSTASRRTWPWHGGELWLMWLLVFGAVRSCVP